MVCILLLIVILCIIGLLYVECCIYEDLKYIKKIARKEHIRKDDDLK